MSDQQYKQQRNDEQQIKSSLPEPQRLGLVWRFLFWFIVMMTFFYFQTNFSANRLQTITYTDFKAKVRADAVKSVIWEGSEIHGELRVPLNSTIEAGGQAPYTSKGVQHFSVTLPPIENQELLSLLEEHDVEVLVKSGELSWWQQLLLSLLPWILFIWLLLYFSDRVREQMFSGDGPGGVFGFAKSKARRFHVGSSTVTFNDVAGQRNAKEELREITDYLKNPQKYRKLGAKIPKGILLMGPPGTGKTLLAKAVAGEAGVAFFSISGSEFIEMFVGVGASRVRDMFAKAKTVAPSIIFIDEIDSVGRARGTGLGGGHDEREQTLNQILGEMDGFDPHEAVVVLAATNRPDVLDSALLRPGRFDRKITLDLPDKVARKAILQIHSQQVPLADDVDLERLAALTVGFAGADLENLVNEAALLAGRESQVSVEMEDMLAARDKVVLGGKRELVISEQDKKLVAFHEAGHALVASLLPHADPLDKVTIIPRGRALGATEQIPEEEQYNLRQSYLQDRIGVMLGGRVAEQVIFKEISSGAEADLKQVTRLARRMVTQWGMSSTLGPVAFHQGEEHVFLGKELAQPRDFSEHIAQLIDQEILSIVTAIEKKVRELLQAHRVQLENLANALLEKETLQQSEIQAIIAQPSLIENRMSAVRYPLNGG